MGAKILFLVTHNAAKWIASGGYLVRAESILSGLRSLDVDILTANFVSAKVWMKAVMAHRVTDVHLIPLLPACRLHLFRMLRDRCAQLCFRRFCVRHSIAIVHAENTEAGFLASSAGLPLVVDFHGDRIAEVTDSRGPRWHSRYMKSIEAKTFAICSAAIVVSERLYETLSSRHKMQRPFQVIPCVLDTSNFTHAAIEAMPYRTEIRREFSLPESSLVFVFMGSMNKWQLIPETIELLHAIKNHFPAVFFLILTADAVPVEYLSRLDDLHIPHRVVSIPHEQIPRVLSACDCGLLLRAESPVNVVASPTKLGEYLASGLPVITTPYAGDASSVVTETKTGFVIDIPFHTDAVKDLCDLLLQMMACRNECFQRCVEAAHKFRDISLMKQRISLLYDRLLTERRRERESVR